MKIQNQIQRWKIEKTNVNLVFLIDNGTGQETWRGYNRRFQLIMQENPSRGR